MTAPGAGTPAATTPGRAAYEAFAAVVLREEPAAGTASWQGVNEQRRGAWEAAAAAAIASHSERVAELAGEGNELRKELAPLRDLFQFAWNEMGMLESDDPRYSYVTAEDQQRLEDLCLAVERAGITEDGGGGRDAT